ncbi:energy conserving hydrogenase EhbF [Methanobrevibacter sp. OttesenSCG-928-K11]|nr:energy conserving hydrogenase EhbF [Methanobrevibacter sp. OttesenSCG-928-K11]MDL2270913.1 energy conserving hydrogenase EhbF [Methanobrevibacter sp. OttesenSCG-928-I08]
MNELIPIMVIIPMTCALLLSLFSNQNKLIKGLAFFVAICIPIIPLLSNYGLHYFGGHAPLISNLTGVLYHPAVTYSFQSLQKLFIFLLGILVFLVVFIYINSYKKASGPYLFLIFMGTAAITALMLSDDIFHMFIFFEIAALVQVGIIAASSIEDRYETALKYMIMGSIGGPMLLLGIGILLAITGSVNITDIVYAINHNLVSMNSPVFLLACGLIFFGWLYTSGLPPFHTIKSAVYSKAEPHAAALLQAFTVITLVSILIAMFRIFSNLPIFEALLVGFALLAMILGISMALTQNDFRRMIGFLAVGELGFIVLGIGLNTEFALTAGLFQAINEMIVTALLFIGFGVVADLIKTSDIRKTGGLIAYYPKLAIMILIGGFSMAGVPPLNGFQSKLMLIQASLSSGFPEISIIAILVSIATFVVFVKVFYAMFLKPKPNDLVIPNKKVPRSTIFAMAILLIMCIILGLFPSIITGYISGFVGGLL